VFIGVLPNQKELMSFRYIGNQNTGNRLEGEFWVDLLIDDEDYSIGIKFDFENLEAKFITVSPKLGGKIDGWELPPKFKYKFYQKNQFVNLFIFDGEMATELNKSQGAELIEHAIRQVTDLHKVFLLVGGNMGGGELLDGHLDDVLSQELNRIKQSSVDNKVKALSTSYNDCKQHIQQIYKRQNEIKKQLKQNKKQLEKITHNLEKIDQGEGSKQNELAQAKDKIKEAKDDLKTITKEKLEYLFNPGIFFERVQNIKDFYKNIEKEKIPRSIGKSFITELLESNRCICGNQWNQTMKLHISNHIEDYLGDDELTIVKNMQYHVRESVCPINSISDTIEDLSNLKNAVKSAEEQLDIVRSSFDETNLNKIKELIEKQTNISNEIYNLEEELENIQTKDLGIIKSKKLDVEVYKLNGEFYTSKNKFSRCINLYTLDRLKDWFDTELESFKELQKIENGISFAKNIINNSLSDLMNILREEVIKKTNYYFSQMHAGGGDHKIKSLDNGLKFINSYGDEMDNVNMAAQLAAAYSYVTSMYQLGEIQVPLIIDSPTTGFGLGVSRNWAKEIPNNFPQIIGFITSAEKIGLLDLCKKDNVSTGTFRRRKEGINGSPQEGEMIFDHDFNFFMNYEVEKDKVVE